MNNKTPNTQQTTPKEQPKERRVIPLVRGPVNKSRFNTMEDLKEWILDLTPEERLKHETAKEISNALQYLVDQRNSKATGYKKEFKERVQEKFEHKIWKKHFGSQGKREILKQIMGNDDVRKKWKAYEKEVETTTNEAKWKFKKEVYEKLKRVFNKEITSHGGRDIDNEAGLFLLRLAKFFINENFKNEKGQAKKTERINFNQISVNPPEKRGEKGLQYDSGGTRNGLEVIPKTNIHTTGNHKGKPYKSLFNALAIADEHGILKGEKDIIQSDKPSSSTHIFYDQLNELGVLNPRYKDQLKRFVDFVDKTDSLDYQFSGADEMKHRTLFGLHRKIDIDKIYEYFENPGRTGFEVLTDNDLKRLGIDSSISAMKAEERERLLKQRGIQLNKGQMGKFNDETFVFATGRDFAGGQKISAETDTGYFSIFESGDLYMYSNKLLPPKISGFSTNDYFLNIHNIKLEDLKKILDIFEFGRVKKQEPEIDEKTGATIKEGVYESTEKIVKEAILKYRSEQIQKEEEKAKILQKTEKEKLDNLATLTNTDDPGYFKKGKTYKGMINNISGKIAFVTLNRETDKEKVIYGRVRVEDKEKLKKYTSGELIEVSIDDNNLGEDGKRKISLSMVEPTVIKEKKIAVKSIAPVRPVIKTEKPVAKVPVKPVAKIEKTVTKVPTKPASKPTKKTKG